MHDAWFLVFELGLWMNQVVLVFELGLWMSQVVDSGKDLSIHLISKQAKFRLQI